MNVGFYYHVEAAVDADGTVRVPASLGVFLEGVARHAGGVTFYGHSRPATGTEDFVISPALVFFVDLGPLRSFPMRTFWPRPALREFRATDRRHDVLFVLGATPLLPHLVRASGPVPVAVMLWSNYSTWRPQVAFPWWRNLLIRVWTVVYGVQQRRATRNRLVFLQDPELAHALDRSARPHVVFMPSLTAEGARRLSGIARRPVAPNGDVALLYSGRIVPEKGVFESVEAVSILRRRGLAVSLRLAGAEEPGSGTADRLRAMALDHDVAGHVHFLGHLDRDSLHDAYSRADILVVPTYWESFPRAAHEAMASGMPVVTTNVGGMKHYLHDRGSAMLVEPRNAIAIADAVEALVTDRSLRERIVSEARSWALAHTVEEASAEIVQHLRGLATA